MADEFTKLILASWQPDGGTEIPLAVTLVDKQIENTLVKQRRPYQNGAKLDKLGLDVVVWTLTIDFYNGCQEPGIPQSGYYPGAVTALEQSARLQKTGTLKVGRDGKVRACLKHISTREGADARDLAAVTATFWEDREDTAQTAAAVTPSAAATVPTLVADIYDECLDAGIYSANLVALVSVGGDLALALGAIATAVAGGLALAAAVEALAELLEDAFSNYYDSDALPAMSLALDSDAAGMIIMLRRMRDRAATAVAGLQAQPTTKVVYFDRVVSIFQVAAAYQQNLDDLIGLNTGHLEPGSFYAIPKGKGVIVAVGP